MQEAEMTLSYLGAYYDYSFPLFQSIKCQFDKQRTCQLKNGRTRMVRQRHRVKLLLAILGGGGGAEQCDV